MAQVFVNGLTYGRDGPMTIRFKLESEIIDQAVALLPEEIDGFMENRNFGDYWASYLIAEIIGNEAVRAEWKEKHEFSVEFDDFVFGVGMTKEAAILQLHDALNDGERGWD